MIVKEFFGYNKRTIILDNDRIHIFVRGEPLCGQSVRGQPRHDQSFGDEPLRGQPLRSQSVRDEALRGQSVLVGNIS